MGAMRWQVHFQNISPKSAPQGKGKGKVHTQTPEISKLFLCVFTHPDTVLPSMSTIA